MDIEHPLLNKRQAEILRIITRQGYATIETLAERFGISQQTIRRDLIMMDKAQILTRHHGGAGIAAGRTRPLYADKLGLAIEAKRTIAARAMEYLQNGMTVYIGIGTTSEALAQALAAQRMALRVVTPSLAVGQALAGHETVETIVTGGTLRSRDGATVGPLAINVIQQFSFERAFIGFSGFDTDGAPMDFDLDKVLVKRAAMQRTNSVIGLADAGKFLRRASVRLASPDTLDCLISESAPPRDLGRQLNRAGVEFVKA